MHLIKCLQENIYGQVLKLRIYKNTNATEVTVKQDTKSNIYIPCLLLLCILLANLTAFINDLVSVNYFLVLIIIKLIFAYKIFYTIKSESLLYIPHLGCQISVHHAFAFSTKFIPAKVIQGIFINEVFSKHRVLFVLSILVKDENSEYIIPLFTSTKPRLKCLQVIYQNLLR